TLEIWHALLRGARLVGLEKETLLAARDFGAALAERRITVMYMNAAPFHALAAQDPAVFGRLRHLMVGGDAMDARLARAVLASGSPPGRLLNGYGPTEAASISTAYDVAALPRDATSVPIGRPIDNTEALVLDGRGE